MLVVVFLCCGWFVCARACVVFVDVRQLPGPVLARLSIAVDFVCRRLFCWPNERRAVENRTHTRAMLLLSCRLALSGEWRVAVACHHHHNPTIICRRCAVMRRQYARQVQSLMDGLELLQIIAVVAVAVCRLPSAAAAVTVTQPRLHPHPHPHAHMRCDKTGRAAG